MGLLKTPLHSLHTELHARMVPFAGFEMPISYDEITGGMIKEHLAVRQHSGMFDVSHMGEFWIEGDGVTEFVSKVCTRPFHKLAAGRAQYCLLLNEQGNIVDDVIVYKLSDHKYWMVVNAANMEKDWSHLSAHNTIPSVHLQNVSDQTALIAIQGPESASVLEKLIPKVSELKYYGFFQPRKDWIVGRTGYTGEDGFEIFLPASEARDLWSNLYEERVLPIGLGARDTLRLEVGFALYGHELSLELRPQETCSAFAVDLNHVFIGSEFCRETPRYRPIAVEGRNAKPFRAEEALLFNGKPVGRLTSGSFSPIRKIGIGLALIENSEVSRSLSEGSVFVLESGGKQREALLAATPFVETARVKRKHQRGK